MSDKNETAARQNPRMTRRAEPKREAYPVMKAQCATCPFRTDARGRLIRPYLTATIQVRALNYASQLCHHPRLHGREETHLCRGARDFQQTIFHHLGVIEAPTYEAWEKKRCEMENHTLCPKEERI